MFTLESCEFLHYDYYRFELESRPLILSKYWLLYYDLSDKSLTILTFFSINEFDISNEFSFTAEIFSIS